MRYIVLCVLLSCFVVPALGQTSHVETLEVPVDGSIVTTISLYDEGTPYLISASGTAFVCEGCGEYTDAEYAFYPVDQDIRDIACGGSVDIGIAIDDLVIDSAAYPHWGAYNPAHIYEVLVMGQGSPFQFQYHDCLYSDNAGHITIEIRDAEVPVSYSTWGTLKARF